MASAKRLRDEMRCGPALLGVEDDITAKRPETRSILESYVVQWQARRGEDSDSVVAPAVAVRGLCVAQEVRSLGGWT